MTLELDDEKIEALYTFLDSSFYERAAILSRRYDTEHELEQAHKALNRIFTALVLERQKLEPSE